MATLFERMTGADGVRISSHAVESSFRELHKGHLTAANIVTMLSLTAGQQTDMTTLWGKINGSANPADRIDELFDFIILAELSERFGGSPYTVEANFWTRINGFD